MLVIEKLQGTLKKILFDIHDQSKFFYFFTAFKIMFTLLILYSTNHLSNIQREVTCYYC